MMVRSRRLAGALVVASLLVAACGGAGGDEQRERQAGNPPAAAGFDGETIKLGVLTPLSGPVAVIGRPLTNGNRAWLDHVNSQGGIAGKYRVELVEEDTQYKSDITVQQYNKIKGEVVAFTQILGTAPTLATLPQLRADKIVASPASLDALWVKDENLVPIGAPYQIQAINAVEHYLTDGGGSKDAKICTMSQDDAYGDAGVEGVEFAADHHGFSIANSQKFKPGTENFTGQIGALRRAHCDMVFLTANPTEAGKIWGTAGQARYTPQWYGQSPAFVGAMTKSPIAPYLAENVLISSEGTEWGDDSVPGMKDMIDRVAEFSPKQEPDYYFIYGYVQAKAMTRVLERAVELGDLSHEGIRDALRQVGTVTFDGLFGDYRYGRAQERTPPRETTIFAVEPGTEFGLKAVKRGVRSEAADAFEFSAK